jgi:uncharacterized protein YukE
MSLRPFALLVLPCLALAVAGDGDRADLCNDGVCHASEDENAALLQSAVAPTKVRVQLPEQLAQKVNATGNKTHVKIRRATVRKSIDLSDVWDQMCGSVHIDELKEKLKTATDKAKETIQAEIDKLEKAYPGAAEIKEKFMDQWNQIVSAVNVDELKKQVKNCAADVASCAKDKLSQLQSQLDGALKGVNLDSIKDQAAETWNKIQLELPDMDELKSALSDYGGQAQAAWDEFMKTNDFSSLTDAATSIASDAWNSVTDTVSGWFR